MSTERFPTAEVTSPQDYLDCAEAAEQYVRTFLEETEDGIRYVAEGSEQNSYYKGLAGILHMYLQLQQILPKPEYQQIIREILRYLKQHYLDDVQTAQREGEFVAGMAEAFYTGLAGIGLVVNEAWAQCRYEEAKQAAEKILDYYMAHQKETAEGVFWSDNAAIFFDGGIILYLIDSYHVLEREDVLPVIVRATDYILSTGIRHKDGGLEIDHGQVVFKHKEPNFEFGTAGSGYLFTKVYELTNDRKYLRAAFDAARYLCGIAVKQEQGYLIPYKLTLKEPLFYLGNCHGPVGTAKLFYELYQVTGDSFYYEQVLELCKGMESLGAPLYQSAGYWNTTCLCCGPAGFVPLYIGLYRQDGDNHWKELAEQIGEILLGTKLEKKEMSNGVEVKTASWRLAYDRTRPEVITAPAGYYTGAAGIVVALLQLYRLEVPGTPVTQMIDDPYRRT